LDGAAIFSHGKSTPRAGRPVEETPRHFVRRALRGVAAINGLVDYLHILTRELAKVGLRSKPRKLIGAIV